jgi:septal ring factor EnvC (AmiA/AmiB activator)
MKNSIGAQRPGPRRQARKLARLNTKITRLNSELETLTFMQDRLQREIESAGRSTAYKNSKNTPR